jgi:ribosome-associated heat shock protein Hsp15
VVEAVRIDKWLWAARFYKTRSAATDAVLGGRVHLNNARVKPSKEIRVGDAVKVRIGQLQWNVGVRGISDKRGPASIARTLYDEAPESIAVREQRVADLKLARPFGADLGARPTKQARRRIEDLRRSQREGRRDEG